MWIAPLLEHSPSRLDNPSSKSRVVTKHAGEDAALKTECKSYTRYD